MSQSSYGAMLGSSSSPLPQSSGFNSLHQHERMVTRPHAALRVGWGAPLGRWRRVAWSRSPAAFRGYLSPLSPSLPELPASFRRG